MNRQYKSLRGLLLSKFERTVYFIIKYLVVLYRIFLSQFFGGACRFAPSCSCYALEALEKHNSLSAFKLILVRLSKCHPLGPFGEDPVPEVKEQI